MYFNYNFKYFNQMSIEPFQHRTSYSYSPNLAAIGASLALVLLFCTKERKRWKISKWDSHFGLS